MFAKLAAAAGFVAVSAQAPPTPTFPVEWTATVSRTGRRNGTQAFTALADFNAKTLYTVSADGKCYAQPERGTIEDRIPDLRKVTYMRNTTFNGVAVYEWQDHATAPPKRYLTTMDANQYPVAFESEQQGVLETYANFKPVTNWPAGTFTPAPSCNATA